ncbi:MAG TPA: xanthine dehydrogenase family protein subunit M [Xanthobacteraceae bacterium]|jgi:carbon-monoxide dehydrogenase medium subunit
MHAFEYRRPATLEEACKALDGLTDSKLLAGGMSIVPVMRQRLANPSALIDLGRIDALKTIEETDGRLRIGAMATHFAVSRSGLVRSKIPALAQLAGGIGDPLVRNRGTIGGSLAHNDPAACYPSSVLALDATVHTNCRDIKAGDFILGTFATALASTEVIVAVSFPPPDAAAYIKFINSSSRFSIVGVFIARSGATVRVGVTGAADHAFRCGPIETALAAAFTPQTARAIKLPADDLISDINGSAAFRAHVIPELAARAVEHCLAGTAGAIV